MEDKKKKMLGLSLGGTMFIHSEGAILSPTCVDDQDAYRRRWDRALYGGDIVPPFWNCLVWLQGKLRNVVF